MTAKPSRVYFIQAGNGGPIKIGVSDDPKARLGQLQVGNPRRLRLIGTIEGDALAERAIHDALSKYRLGGEWFRAAPQVRERITRELIGEVIRVGGPGFVERVQALCRASARIRGRYPEAFPAIAPTPEEQARAAGLLEPLVTGALPARERAS